MKRFRSTAELVSKMSRRRAIELFCQIKTLASAGKSRSYDGEWEVELRKKIGDMDETQEIQKYNQKQRLDLHFSA